MIFNIICSVLRICLPRRVLTRDCESCAPCIQTSRSPLANTSVRIGGTFLISTTCASRLALLNVRVCPCLCLGSCVALDDSFVPMHSFPYPVNVTGSLGCLRPPRLQPHEQPPGELSQRAQSAHSFDCRPVLNLGHPSSH